MKAKGLENISDDEIFKEYKVRHERMRDLSNQEELESQRKLVNGNKLFRVHIQASDYGYCLAANEKEAKATIKNAIKKFDLDSVGIRSWDDELEDAAVVVGAEEVRTLKQAKKDKNYEVFTKDLSYDFSVDVEEYFELLESDKGSSKK